MALKWLRTLGLGHFFQAFVFNNQVRRGGMYNKVYVEITNICNMNCSFCHGHSRALRQMTEAE